MPEPQAICLEDLDPAPGAPRFVRCVAIVGRQPGLRISRQGTLLWKSDEDVACEMWVSGDERLILFRPEGAPVVRVARAGRGIDAPHGKPVVLLHEDEVYIGSRRFRVYVHGPAPTVHEPTPLADSAWNFTSKVVAAVALGAAMVGCKPVEVRDSPPAMVPMPTDSAPVAPPTAEPTASTAPTTAPTSTIEVRDTPPVVAPMPEPPPPAPTSK